MLAFPGQRRRRGVTPTDTKIRLKVQSLYVFSCRHDRKDQAKVQRESRRKMSQDRLKSLQQALHKSRVDGFLLPLNDEFMSEYPPASARRLQWLTGFSGSAGAAV